jgi:hypothetical protein
MDVHQSTDWFSANVSVCGSTESGTLLLSESMTLSSLNQVSSLLRLADMAGPPNPPPHPNEIRMDDAGHRANRPPSCRGSSLSNRAYFAYFASSYSDSCLLPPRPVRYRHCRPISTGLSPSPLLPTTRYQKERAGELSDRGLHRRRLDLNPAAAAMAPVPAHKYIRADLAYWGLSNLYTGLDSAASTPP